MFFLKEMRLGGCITSTKATNKNKANKGTRNPFTMTCPEIGLQSSKSKTGLK